MTLPLHIQKIVQVYRNASTVRTRKSFTTVNELTDQVPALRPDVLMAAATSIMSLGPMWGNKLLTEDDKGAVLAGIISVMSGLELAMARPHVYDIPGSIKVPMSMEYMDSTLIVNGVDEGDKVVLIDDTLSTGGTIIALARAVKEAGAEVIDIRVVVEKLGFGGRGRLMDELGMYAQSVIGISIDDTGVITVREALGTPLDVHESADV